MGVCVCWDDLRVCVCILREAWYFSQTCKFLSGPVTECHPVWNLLTALPPGDLQPCIWCAGLCFKYSRINGWDELRVFAHQCFTCSSCVIVFWVGNFFSCLREQILSEPRLSVSQTSRRLFADTDAERLWWLILVPIFVDSQLRLHDVEGKQHI